MKLKRRDEHIVMYNKEESVKLLKEDSRIKEIIDEPFKLTIKTKPIKLKPEEKMYKNMMVCPIGSYTIVMKQWINSNKKGTYIVNVGINRHDGTVSPFSSRDRNSEWHTHHVCNDFSGGKICWGTASDDYYTLMRHTDWFWLSKLALDLICDAEPEYGQSDIYNHVVPFLQLKYAIKVKNKKWERKLRTYIFKKFRRVRLKKWLC